MKEVIILAVGPSYVECPYDAEVWACWSTIIRDDHPAQRIDKLITVHSQQMECPSQAWWDYLHRAQKRLGFEIITPEPWEGIKTTPYPIEDILKTFGTAYFVDSVCYMIALAIYQGYEMIRFYGVDCRAYAYAVTERACTEFWCGVARGKGLQLRIAGTLCNVLETGSQPVKLPMDPYDWKLCLKT